MQHRRTNPGPDATNEPRRGPDGPLWAQERRDSPHSGSRCCIQPGVVFGLLHSGEGWPKRRGLQAVEFQRQPTPKRADPRRFRVGGRWHRAFARSGSLQSVSTRSLVGGRGRWSKPLLFPAFCLPTSSRGLQRGHPLSCVSPAWAATRLPLSLDLLDLFAAPHRSVGCCAGPPGASRAAPPCVLRAGLVLTRPFLLPGHDAHPPCVLDLLVFFEDPTAPTLARAHDR